MSGSHALLWTKLRDDLRNFRVGRLPEVKERLEISDLCQNELQFNLFILALRELQEQPAVDGDLRRANLNKDFLSYFHLSALHGAPDVDWGNVPMNWFFGYLKRHNLVAKQWDKPDRLAAMNLNSNPVPAASQVGTVNGGYCVHHSPLFLPWHRPYLALLEQIIVITAIDIAKKYSEAEGRTEALKAAEALRFPFWDFSRPTSGDYNNPSTLRYDMPPPLTCKFVRVKKPGSALFEVVPNPLYSFQYPSDATLRAAFPDDVYSTTINAGASFIAKIRDHNPNLPPNQPCFTTRHPTTATGRSSTPSLNDRLNRIAQVQKMRVFYTLTRVQDFPQVSCAKLVADAASNNGQRAVVNRMGQYYTASLENIHDDYHIMIGGYRGRDDAMQQKIGIVAGLDAATNSPGTFTNFATAAFEPSFWLMHNFWEYTTCLWQMLHPDRFWKSRETVRRNDSNCAWLRPSSLETTQTPLVPFRKRVEGRAIFTKSSDAFWTTENSEDWTKFGYTFPDCPTSFTQYTNNPLAKNSRKKLSDNKVTATTRVNALYGFIYGYDAVSRNAINTATGSTETGSTGDNLFKYITPTWDPNTSTRNSGTEVQRYYPLVPYATLDWFPKRTDGTPLTDDTVIADIEVDAAPEVHVARTFAMFAEKSPRLAEPQTFHISETTKPTRNSMKVMSIQQDEGSHEIRPLRKVADQSGITKSKDARHEENLSRAAEKSSVARKSDKPRDSLDSKHSDPVVAKSHKSRPSQDSKRERADSVNSHKSQSSQNQKVSDPASAVSHRSRPTSGVKRHDSDAAKSHRSKPSEEKAVADSTAIKSHRPRVSQDGKMSESAASKLDKTPSKQPKRVSESTPAKTHKSQSSRDLKQSSTTGTKSHKSRHSREVSKDIRKSSEKKPVDSLKTTLGRETESIANERTQHVDTSSSDPDTSDSDRTTEIRKSVSTTGTATILEAAPKAGIIESKSQPRFLDCDKDGNFVHWNFVYQVQKFGLFGMFTIHVFIGDFPVSSGEWETSANYVNTSGVWARTLDREDPENTSCANCRNQIRDETMYGDWVPLTIKLLDYVITGAEEPPNSGMRLRSMDREDVIPFLIRNLHWRVIDVDGKEVARDQTPGLLVYVVSEPVKIPDTPTELPVWGEVTIHHEITHNRPSGLCHPGEDDD